jgi:putative FmdB family regulatory protein
MPLYEYQCESCAQRFERIQKYSDPPVAECPSCGGPVKKLLSSPAIQFKGSGWYITDYAKKPAPGDSKSESGSDGKSDGASKEGSSDSAAAPAAPAKDSKDSTPSAKKE